MAFESGRVAFRRFRVHERGSDAPPDSAPLVVDETTLATLAEQAFREADVPTEIESGWLGGEHLFDTRFSYEKNGYGDMLLFALRLDTHRVPADLKHAYRRMQEQVMLNDATRANPTGFLSRSEKRQAREEAERQLREEVSSGRFRRSRQVPLMWDLKRHIVYCGVLGDTVAEQLAKRFHESFNLDLAPMTAGVVASHQLLTSGRHRDYEDLRPSAFTGPPGVASHDEEGPALGDAPLCPWLPPTFEAKDFLGNEWLIWLWWMIETHEGVLTLPKEMGGDEVALMIDQTLDTECAWGITGKQSLRADGPTRLPEAGEALLRGKWPRKARITLADIGEGQQWTFTVQADLMQVSAGVLPEVEEVNSARELIEQRLVLIRRLSWLLDGVYGAFLSERVDAGWSERRREISRWIKSRRRFSKSSSGVGVERPVEVSAGD